MRLLCRNHGSVGTCGQRVTRSRGPQPPGRITRVLRHFLATSGSVGADDGESPARRGRWGGAGAATERLAARECRSPRGMRPGPAARRVFDGALCDNFQLPPNTSCHMSRGNEERHHLVTVVDAKGSSCSNSFFMPVR